MARPITLMAFFLIAISLFSGFLQSSGVAATLHLDQRVGGEDAVKDARSSTNDIDTGAPTGDTLFGMYNVLTKQLANVLGIINPGLRMLYNAGAPAEFVGGPNTVGLLPPLATFVKAIGIMSFIRGWGL